MDTGGDWSYVLSQRFLVIISAIMGMELRMKWGVAVTIIINIMCHVWHRDLDSTQPLQIPAQLLSSCVNWANNFILFEPVFFSVK